MKILITTKSGALLTYNDVCDLHIVNGNLYFNRIKKTKRNFLFSFKKDRLPIEIDDDGYSDNNYSDNDGFDKYIRISNYQSIKIL